MLQEFVEVIATDTRDDRFAGKIDSVVHIPVENTDLVV